MERPGQAVKTTEPKTQKADALMRKHAPAIAFTIWEFLLVHSHPFMETKRVECGLEAFQNKYYLQYSTSYIRVVLGLTSYLIPEVLVSALLESGTNDKEMSRQLEKLFRDTNYYTFQSYSRVVDDKTTSPMLGSNEYETFRDMQASSKERMLWFWTVHGRGRKASASVRFPALMAGEKLAALDRVVALLDFICVNGELSEEKITGDGRLYSLMCRRIQAQLPISSLAIDDVWALRSAIDEARKKITSRNPEDIRARRAQRARNCTQKCAERRILLSECDTCLQAKCLKENEDKVKIERREAARDKILAKRKAEKAVIEKNEVIVENKKQTKQDRVERKYQRKAAKAANRDAEPTPPTWSSSLGRQSLFDDDHESDTSSGTDTISDAKSDVVETTPRPSWKRRSSLEMWIRSKCSSSDLGTSSPGEKTGNVRKYEKAEKGMNEEKGEKSKKVGSSEKGGGVVESEDTKRHRKGKKGRRLSKERKDMNAANGKKDELSMARRIQADEDGDLGSGLLQLDDECPEEEGMTKKPEREEGTGLSQALICFAG